MKTLQDYLNESMLDDLKDQAGEARNMKLEQWIQDNCKGQFKAVRTKGGFKVLGEMNIINAVDIPITIVSINGSLNIENCAELKNLEGLFADNAKECVMNLSITDCKNFESLKGLPRHITGNLSLVNCPNFKFDDKYTIDGNVYIFKCGRRPKETFVRQMLNPLGTVMCCEEPEKTSITEAFNEPHLYEIDKYMKDNKLGSFSNMIYNNSIDASEIRPSDAMIYSPVTDKALSVARTALAGSFQSLILMKRDGKYIGYTPCTETKYGILTYFFPVGDKKIYALTRDNHEYFEWIDRDGKMTIKKTELIDIFRGCDEIIIYNLSNRHSFDKHVQRIRAKSDMIRTEFRDEEERARYYKDLARVNMKRYKEMVESVRVRKDSEFEKVDKAVGEVLELQQNLNRKIFRNPAILKSKYEYEMINDKIYGTSGSIMNYFNAYIKLYIDLSNKTSYNTDIDKGYLVKHRDNILKMCAEVSAKLKSLGA